MYGRNEDEMGMFEIIARMSGVQERDVKQCFNDFGRFLTIALQLQDEVTVRGLGKFYNFTTAKKERYNVIKGEKTISGGYKVIKFKQALRKKEKGE